MRSTVFAASAVLCAASALHAASIGIHFYNGGTSGAGYIAPGAAAGVVSNANFNDVTIPSTTATPSSPGTAAALKNDSGTPTTASLSFTDSSTYTGGDSEGFATISGNYNLYETELYGSTTVSVSSIPYAQYSVYVYLGTDSNDRSQQIKLGTTAGTGTVDGTIYYETVNNATAPSSAGTFLQGTNTSSTATTGGTVNSGDYQKANYVVFTGNTAGSFTLSEDVYDFGQYHPSGLAGLEIVDTTPAVTVPEPASLGLLVVGGLAMLRRRR
jgi:hypothetical protein